MDISTIGPESSISPEAEAYFASLEGNPPHVALGMVQEFTVTSADSTPGPLPEAASPAPMAETSPAPEG